MAVYALNVFMVCVEKMPVTLDFVHADILYMYLLLLSTTLSMNTRVTTTLKHSYKNLGLFEFI